MIVIIECIRVADKGQIMPIKIKIISSFGAILIAITLSFALITAKILSQGPALETMKTDVIETSSSTIPLFKAIDNMHMDVVQVQQWLTDISATRGLSGLDDGFAEAKKAADKFKLDLKKARGHASDLGLHDIVKKLGIANEKFTPYYNTGVKMAQSYVKDGPGAGNKMMSSFDAVAEEIGDTLNQLLVSVGKYTREQLSNLSKKSAELDANNHNMVNNIFIVMGVIILFIIGVSTYLFITIRRNFDNMHSDLETVMNKDMATPLRTNPDGKDEFAAVGRSLVVFRKALAEIEEMNAREIEQKQRAEQERCAMMHELADNFDINIGGIIETVSAASTELNATARSMTGIAEQTSTLSSTVSAASEEATGNVQTVAAASEQMSNSIAEISQQVSQASGAARQAVAEVEKTGSQMQALAATADKINDVIGMISDIAEQTNLLALNATIESARAGEAGKGFAVVASEVKGLAGQTAKATEDIVAQVEEIQNATKQAVISMDDIGKIIKQVDEASTAIAAAMDEQGSATREIARNVHEAATGTEEVSRNITGVIEASQEAGAASGQVMSAADELSQQSEKLKTEVGKFIARIRTG